MVFGTLSLIKTALADRSLMIQGPPLFELCSVTIIAYLPKANIPHVLLPEDS